MVNTKSDSLLKDLRRRVGDDRPMLGVMFTSSGTVMAEACANAGLDFVVVDQMITSVDWTETAAMLRAIFRGGASPWVRLAAYPWSGAVQGPMLQRDALRAISIGAEGITASVDTVPDAQDLIALRGDPHANHSTYSVSPPASIFPIVESMNAFERLADIVALDGMEALVLGIGDLSRVLDVPRDWGSKETRAAVRDAVALCTAHGLEVQTPLLASLNFSESMKNVEALWELGIRTLWLPHPTAILHQYFSKVVRECRR